MKIVLSGFAGVGKSTIIEHIKENHPEVFISPESAREVNYSNDFFKINDPLFEFFQKSVMDNEIMKVVLTHLNKIENVVYDRCLVDNLAFAEVFYGTERINYRSVQQFILDLKKDYKVDHLYDAIIFIKSTRNEDFVNQFILNDPFRKATTASTAKDFIEKSIYWEELYFEILDKLNFISPTLIKLEHFSENANYENDINSFIEKYLKSK